MKHLTHFRNFVNEGEAAVLSSGEKAAITRGDDILTAAQGAVCYLYAKELSHKLYYASAKGSVMADQISTKQRENVADSIGIKAQSFTRAVKKFRILLGKEEQGNENIYPKIEKELFEPFEEMSIDQVVELGKTAFTEEASLRGEEYKKARIDKQAKAKKHDSKTAFEVNGMYPQLYTHYVKTLSPEDAKQKAIGITMTKLGLTKKQVTDIVG